MGLSPAGLLDSLLQRLFPLRCLGCGLRGASVCPGCWPRLPWLTDAVCPYCAAPSRLARICGRCQADSARLDGVRAACQFDGIVRKAVHDLKYRGIRERSVLLADLVVEALARRPLAMDLIVPVPVAAGRRRQRGFNQAELVSTHVGERLGISVLPSALERVRETPRQVGRTAAERRANIAGAFSCPAPAAVAGRRVALIDDVMTTGATLGAAAEAIRAAGASRVYGVVVAREV